MGQDAGRPGGSAHPPAPPRRTGSLRGLPLWQPPVGPAVGSGVGGTAGARPRAWCGRAGQLESYFFAGVVAALRAAFFLAARFFRMTLARLRRSVFFVLERAMNISSSGAPRG